MDQREAENVYADVQEGTDDKLIAFPSGISQSVMKGATFYFTIGEFKEIELEKRKERV